MQYCAGPLPPLCLEMAAISLLFTTWPSLLSFDGQLCWAIKAHLRVDRTRHDKRLAWLSGNVGFLGTCELCFYL